MTTYRIRTDRPLAYAVTDASGRALTTEQVEQLAEMGAAVRYGEPGTDWYAHTPDDEAFASGPLEEA